VPLHLHPVCYLLSSLLQGPAFLWTDAAHKPTWRYVSLHRNHTVPAICLRLNPPNFKLVQGCMFVSGFLCTPGTSIWQKHNQELLEQLTVMPHTFDASIPHSCSMPSFKRLCCRSPHPPFSHLLRLLPVPLQAAVSVAEFIKRHLWDPSNKRLKRAFCKAPSAVEGEQA
jgi:hypothetical protein